MTVLVPGEPLPPSPGRIGAPFPSPWRSAVLLASVYPTVRLSIEPLEQDPTSTPPCIQSPWQSPWGMMLKKGKEGERKDGAQRLGRWVSSVFLSL